MILRKIRIHTISNISGNLCILDICSSDFLKKKLIISQFSKIKIENSRYGGLMVVLIFSSFLPAPLSFSSFSFSFSFFSSSLWFCWLKPKSLLRICYRSFSVTPRLSGRYGDLPHTPTPQAWHSLQCMNLYWHVIITPTPWLTSGLTLGVVYFVTLEKCMVTCIHRYSITQRISRVLQILCAL